ncbi:universal stress protein [Chitinophagaceae bacterium 26-R-25]|nr:universal stress protein [Chitinophagaceae bacterium 26-R-25]
MKKIIVAIDGLKFSHSTTNYAIHLAKQTYAHVVGVFLDDFSYHSYRVYELANVPVDELQEKIDYLGERDARKREAAAEEFREACNSANLPCTIHHSKNFALNELLHESVYADLLIINRKETFSHFDDSIPSTFIKDLMAGVQCPVLVVPNSFKKIEEIMLLYDGKPSSVYAIKMFGYIFPLLNKLDTEVLFVNEESPMYLPDNKLVKEFIRLHIPNATYTVLKGAPQDEIIRYCKERTKNKMIVLGAYSRGTVSRWFQHSMADALMQQLDNPLFIAHNK